MGRGALSHGTPSALKQFGGLGIKDIGRQNEALLVKRLHHLHSGRSPWASWIWKEHSDCALAEHIPLGPH